MFCSVGEKFRSEKNLFTFPELISSCLSWKKMQTCESAETAFAIATVRSLGVLNV